MKRFKQAWRAFKTSWAAADDKNLVTINLRYNSDEVSPRNADCKRTIPGKLYDIRIGPQIPFPLDAVLAHEIGHVISNLQGQKGYEDYGLLSRGITTISVLKEEARAWRNALKIIPSISRALIADVYGQYVAMFKKD